MKKMFLLFVCLILVTGCGNNYIKENSSSIKSYELEEIKLNCGLENITYVDSKSLISNNKLYVYSSKKYSETNTNCKMLGDKHKNYYWIGNLYWFDSGNPENFITDSNDTLYYIRNGELKEHILDNEYQLNVLNDYRNNDFYYFDNGTYITDDIIHGSLIDSHYDIKHDKKILHVVRISGELYIVTESNVYYVGVSDDDKCHEYEDVKCNYTLIKTNVLDEFLNDYKNNISYFNGHYFITKDNKIYRTTFYKNK